MASNFTVPPRTIAAGITVLGPATPGAGLHGLELDLDIGNLTQPCSFLLEVAFDGVSWQDVAEQNVTGPPRDRAGNLVVPATMRWVAPFGNTVDGAIVTTASSKVRLTVTNTASFASAGGTLTTF